MKLMRTSTIAAAGLACAFTLAACNSHPSAMRESMAPTITASASHKEALTGESVLVDARTTNFGEGSKVKWSVSPDVAKISPTDDSRGLSAMFSADQPGTYVVTASAKLPDGNMLRSETNIVVKGRAMSSD